MKKKIIIISVILSILIIGIVLLFVFFPHKSEKKEIVLNKKEKTYFEVEVYSDIYLDKLVGKDLKKNIKIDTDKLGKYTLEYIDKDNNKKSVTINVVDTTPPVVMLGNTYYHIQGTNFTILDDTVCADNYDDKPDCKVECEFDTNIVGVYDAKYTAIDSSGNEFKKDFKVQVVPRTKEEKKTISFDKVKERVGNYKLLIDVSKWEKDIDWKKVKDSGIEYAFIRLGTEKYNTNEMILDPYFEKNYKEAKENGIKVGVYFYTYVKSLEDLEIRANFILDNLKDKEIDLGVAYDFECWEVYNSLNLSLHKLNVIKDRFMTIMEEHGYRPILYSSKNYLEKIWDVKSEAVWLAHYTEETNYAGDKIIWQFASNAIIPGISIDEVDVNVYYE